MKIQIALLAAALLAGCAQQASNAEDAATVPAAATTDAAPSQPAEASTGAEANMGMDPAAHQKMAEDAASMGMSAEAHEAMGMAGGDAKAQAGAKAEATGMGVVKSIDAAAGKVTIDHEPIAALNWPSMTMAFNASPELLAAVKEGDRVHFEFTQGDGGSTLSVLQPRK
ncbi:copper-binding protein [Stenotrophomonas maltophilia]|uniref:copper-binding protein n=1 Tax=Stenotrophomonas maltophilia TaxID=40324 RepID=UPI00223AA15F|nr:copper-binding protein [Stenotrophomonas maltophilia]